MVKRLKRRYVVVKAEPRIRGDLLTKAINSSYRELFGVHGLAISGFRVMKIYDDGVAIIRCFLENLPKLLLATAAITELDGRPTAVRTLMISGSMKKAKEVAESYV